LLGLPRFRFSRENPDRRVRVTIIILWPSANDPAAWRAASPTGVVLADQAVSRKEKRMPRFTIYPTDQAFSSADVTAFDAGAVLHVVGRLRCTAADVHREGEYLFSVRAADGGAWTIFQRDGNGRLTQTSVLE
jgi:hypothetical protein